ncbi:MAG TPA: M20/M25/M40 family metallo-hydrolase [Gemmatimonadaceae bacterium]|nr:M20/M25/M40 family metallo-hydrolase [Gemmatimonadaceae bacterium]
MPPRRAAKQLLFTLMLLLCSTAVLSAQRRAPASERALEALRTGNEWTLSQQISICEIAAPPFKEQQRGEEFARRLRALGLQNVRIDREGNVLAERPGAATTPLIVLSAHLDTVFPEGTDVRVRRSADTLRGPGISDDCRGLAVVLAVARALRDSGIRTAGTIVFAGTVGEEGAGNLRGVRHLVDVELRDRIDYFISVDGAGQNVTSAGVGSIRYKATFFGPGGHSYGAFGIANPVHALGRAIARLAELQVPASPRTTFNVGVIGGGTSVNSIATEAWMDLDMRSVSPVELQKLEAAARAALDSAVADERARWPRSNVPLGVRIDTIGVRPAAAQPDTARIVRLAVETGRASGLMPRTSASSTDANYPMSRGIPAIEMDGGGSGRASHSPDEMYVDGALGYRGPQWVMRLVLALAGQQR